MPQQQSSKLIELTSDSSTSQSLDLDLQSAELAKDPVLSEIDISLGRNHMALMFGIARAYRLENNISPDQELELDLSNAEVEHYLELPEIAQQLRKVQALARVRNYLADKQLRKSHP